MESMAISLSHVRSRPDLVDAVSEQGQLGGGTEPREGFERELDVQAETGATEVSVAGLGSPQISQGMVTQAAKEPDRVLAALEGNPERVKMQSPEVQALFRRIEDLKAFYRAVSEGPQSQVNLRALLAEIEKAKEGLAEVVDLRPFFGVMEEGRALGPPLEEVPVFRERLSESFGPERQEGAEASGSLEGDGKSSKESLSEAAVQDRIEVSVGKPVAESKHPSEGISIEELWVRRELEKAGFKETGLEKDVPPRLTAHGNSHIQGVAGDPVLSKHAEGNAKPDLAEQVVDRTKGMIETLRFSPEGTKRSVEIQLFPPDLGRMKIDMEMVHNEVKVNIHVEHDAAKGMLDQNVAWLRESLERRDIRLSELQVHLRHEGAFPNYGHFNQSGMSGRFSRDGRAAWKKEAPTARGPIADVTAVGEGGPSHGQAVFWTAPLFLRRAIDLVV